MVVWRQHHIQVSGELLQTIECAYKIYIYATRFKSLIGETSILFTLNLLLSDKRNDSWNNKSIIVHVCMGWAGSNKQSILSFHPSCTLFVSIEYGRTCRDIGCLPREVCTMAYDSCSFNQQEGTNCGRYPTCVKADKTQQPPPQQNTGKHSMTLINHVISKIWKWG